MKWFISLYLMAFSYSLKAQQNKVFDIQINYVATELLLPLSPFKGFEKGKFCRLTITDTTIYLDSIKKIGANTAALPLLSDFVILNKSKDNLKFLVLSNWYDTVRNLNTLTGLAFIYLIELSDKKMRIAIYSGYHDDWSRKHIEVDPASLPYTAPFMTGDINQISGVDSRQKK